MSTGYKFGMIKDHRLSEHLASLRDAETNGTLAPKTKLVELDTHNPLMKDLTDPSSVYIPCSLILEGKKFPRTPGKDIRMYITFNRLLVAPRIRCVCLLRLSGRVLDTLRLTVDFHFNNYGSTGRGIESFRWHGGQIAFTARGATSSGFTRLDSLEEEDLSKEQKETAKALRFLIKPDATTAIKFKLNEEDSDAKEWRINNIRGRLPGGKISTLLSIGRVEYMAYGAEQELAEITYPPTNGVPSKRFAGPLAGMLLARFPLPFVPFRCEYSFATKKEAIVELFHSALGADTESRVELSLWATPKHKGKLYKCRDFHVIAIPQFSNFRILGDKKEKWATSMKLPGELEVYMRFEIPGLYYSMKLWERYGDSDDRLTGVLLNGPPAGLAHHQEIFRITSALPKELEKFASSPADEGVEEFEIHFEPHYNAFTFKSQIDTVSQLQECERWDDILLNQDYSGLKTVDTTRASTLLQETKDELYQILRTCYSWNVEQMRVIDGITKLQGGMALVMGPDGTGKRTLQRALSIFYYALGYHILSLGPANEGCNNMVSHMRTHELVAEFPKFEPYLKDFQLLRLFPGSRDKKIEKLTEDQANNKRVGHEDGAAVSFKELLIALDEKENVQGTVQEFSILQTMIRTAESGSLSLPRGEKDAWQILKNLIRNYRDRTLDTEDLDEYDKRDFVQVFLACKHHIVRHSRYVVTTTINSRTKELGEHWFDKNGAPRHGVIIFVDDAPSEVEVNVWSGIVNKRWADHVQGTFLLGDERQMGPINTCYKGRCQYSPFAKRLDISLPARLICQGFPTFHLEEQRYMHPVLSAFPRQFVYDGQMRDAPGMDVDLEAVKPGLKEVLLNIIGCDKIEDPKERDTKARLAWIQIKGKLLPGSKSRVILKHIEVFFSKIFPKLHDYFKSRDEKMVDNVLILCSYSRALTLYKKRIQNMIEGGFFAPDEVPHVEDAFRGLTVDSSQKRGALMCFFDGSLQGGEEKDVGFLKDGGRFNVAITRASDVFWIIGGDMHADKGDVGIPAITQYKRKMEQAGQVHNLTSG